MPTTRRGTRQPNSLQTRDPEQLGEELLFKGVTQIGENEPDPLMETGPVGAGCR